MAAEPSRRTRHFQLTRAPAGDIPALTAAFVTLLYAIAYLVWERNDWGTPEIRNLVSNVAFMPLNLGGGDADRAGLPVPGPRSRRAPRLALPGDSAR